MHRARTPIRTRGFTLIELMVAMALGLVVTGVVLFSFLGSRQAQRTAVTMARMTDDANLAFSLMRRYIGMAGYSETTNVSAAGLTRAFSGLAVFGCSSSFSNDTVRNPTALTCTNNTGVGADAIVVQYQANASNSLMGRRDGGGIDEPRDALGQFLYLAAGTDPDYVAQARFRVNATGSLIIQGNGGAANGANSPPPAIVSAGSTVLDNVQDMRIWYGLSGLNAAGKPDQVVTRYVDAQAIGGPAVAAWNEVAAVRVCLLLVSDEPVLEEPTSYYDCAASVDAAPALTAPPANPTAAQKEEFRRLHRAFVTTIHVPNRLGG